MSDWLPAFVAARMAQEAARSAHDRAWVAAAGGMHLFDTMGSVVALRPDGTVWFCDDPDDRDPQTWVWQRADERERVSALVAASRRIPELARLLPPRPAGVPDCEYCGGTGRLAGIGSVGCWECSGLGWLSGAAT